MHPFQTYLPNHWNQWIEKFALDRSDGKYTDLNDSDFAKDLKLRFVDDSVVSFVGAFAVKNKQKEEIAVFTEHCGYHVFNMHSIEDLDGDCYDV
jgi:hypothetical protein